VTTALTPRAPVMALGTLEDPERLGRLLATSGYFSDARDAAQAVVKVLAGAELGFGPIASMTGVYIVKGRVTLSANLMAAAVKRSGRYDYRVAEHSATRAAIEFYDGAKQIGTSEFTMEDATRAGLAGGENWRKYPANMLFARAMSNGAKWFCPDVFSGSPVYTPDELGADVDAEGDVIVESSPPPPQVFEPVSQTMVAEPPPKPTPPPSIVPPVKPEPKPEPEPVATNGDVPMVDRDSAVTPEEVEKLEELFRARNVQPRFWKLALAQSGKDSLSQLTRGEAHDMRAELDRRFPA
jgi:hypothetical protein